jgi:hypothetical protein
VKQLLQGGKPVVTAINGLAAGAGFAVALLATLSLRLMRPDSAPPRRESRQHNGITVRHPSQPTFATKSARLRHADCAAGCPLSGITQKTFARTEFFSV